MELIRPSYEILTPINRELILKAIEIAGRTCYKSEDKITEDSAAKFVEMISGRHHDSVLEHQHMSVRFICDRGVSHEFVRHRLASFSQESTRYCNYSKDKFDNTLTFIIPPWVNVKEGIGTTVGREYKDKADFNWTSAMRTAEVTYLELLEHGWKPEQARSVLPNSLKTEIVITSNLRHWKEIFRQRIAPVAHPQMRELMVPLYMELKEVLPEIFCDD